MQQDTSFRYRVIKNESVTITVTPVEVPATVTAAQNGQPLDDVGTPKEQRFAFKATAESQQSHIAILEFHFPPNPRSDAHFAVATSGADGVSFHVTDKYRTRRGTIDIEYRVQ